MFCWDYFFTNYFIDAMCIFNADGDQQIQNNWLIEQKLGLNLTFSPSIGPINLISWAGVKLNWFDFLGAEASSGHKIRSPPDQSH